VLTVVRAVLKAVCLPEATVFPLTNKRKAKGQLKGFLAWVNFIHLPLAKRLAKLSPDSTRRIQRAHRLALGRPATEREVVDAAGFITAYSAASDEAKAWDTWCRVLLSSNEFLYVN